MTLQITQESSRLKAAQDTRNGRYLQPSISSYSVGSETNYTNDFRNTHNILCDRKHRHKHNNRNEITNMDNVSRIYNSQ